MLYFHCLNVYIYTHLNRWDIFSISKPTAIPGNSFASTTAQVNLIASLVNGAGWLSLNKATSGVSGRNMKRESDDGMKPDDEPAQLFKKSKSFSGGSDRKRGAKDDDLNAQPVRKRCRGKQPDLHGGSCIDKIMNQAQKAVVKSRGRPKGTKKDETAVKKDRDGKSTSLTVWKKMEIILEYERLRKLGTIKKVESYMLKNGKMKGGYQGCLSQSKWLGARERYKWDDFIKHCPKLSRKVHEVPNALLEVLGVSVSRLSKTSFLYIYI